MDPQQRAHLTLLLAFHVGSTSGPLCGLYPWLWAWEPESFMSINGKRVRVVPWCRELPLCRAEAQLDGVGALWAEPGAL